MSSICKFCNTKFKNVYVLDKHIKTAKYCLIKQGKIEKATEKFKCTLCNKTLSSKKNFENHNCMKEKIKPKYICNLCDKTLSTKQSLNIHKKKCIDKDNLHDCQYCYEVFQTNNSLIIQQTKCVKKFEWQINELENKLENNTIELENAHKLDLEKNKFEYTKQINDLQNKIENIALKAVNKPTTKQINTMNNTLNINNIDFMSYMTEDRIKDVFSKCFTIKTLYGSNEALVDFTIDNFLSGEDKPIYLCPDKERKKFYFLDKENKRIEDTNAKILTNLIFKHGFDYVKKLYNNHIQNIKEEPVKLNDSFKTLQSLDKNNKDYISQLSNKLPKSIEERYILDEIKKETIEDDKKSIEYVIEDSDSDSESDDNSNEDKYKNPEIIANMLEITRNKLAVFKKWYIETGEIKVSKEFKQSKKNIDRYIKYLQS